MILGAIADDFTGASDLADTLARGGMRTVQTIGVPRPGHDYGDPDALVVALKTRSIPAAEAVAQSLDALRALRERGAELILFKYCSTFDSTDAGNIGPVADALLDALGAPFTIACPAFPANGRRIFNGYLFVDDVLLSESGMRDHPITPMRDANLVRVLARQTPHRVGKIDFATVRAGRAAIAAALAAAERDGLRHAIVDAVDEDDLHAIGAAALDAKLALITGGSGIAMGLPAALRERGALAASDGSGSQVTVSGAAAILAGSCSRATRAQVAYARTRLPVFDLSERDLEQPAALADEALAWASSRLGEQPILITASAPPERVAENQRKYGPDEASARVEQTLAAIARGLRERGVGRFVVAGGETSGAIVAALAVEALRIGKPIAPGVPWTTTLEGPPLALALKSGNFGGEDFFLRAWEEAP
ncbi:MAG TPA: 3-oxo-tetronate kinase [Candidatus Acidoferrum sp.]|nr:3-oxo-tetronate kinase [Candidatus Acidoferrum sp.]